MTSPSKSLPTGVVNFLFTDIEGSTQLWEGNPDAMRPALAVHDRIIAEAVDGSDGAVFKTGGDAFCAAFADPHQALNAATAAQHALLETEWETESPIKVRMGLHTGTAQVRDGDYFGPTLNRVARVMSTGHGGQILVSTSTHRLLVDELPPGVQLLSLGSHYLKDLDRPEEIFQVVAEGLPDDFAPLSTVSTELSGLASAAESAFQSKNWQESCDLLKELEEEHDLNGEQHEMMAYALWWLGKHDDLTRRFESAYNAFQAEGDHERAAITALSLAETYYHALSPDISRAWERRAERLLEDDEGSVAKGYLLRSQLVKALEIENDLETALELSGKVMDIAKAQNDGNLEAMALQDKGRILVAEGNMDEGMALMDEAMVAAVAGDVNPVVVGRSYCNMLAVCDQTGDVRRASEWSDAAARWCSENETGPYPGVCRIHRAEVMWQKGDWVGAEAEVMSASTELGMLTDLVGEAWYQFGAMRLRVGDYEGAEHAFQEALTRGREPVPGYALLLAHQGEIGPAIDLLERVLEEPTLAKLSRARFLPALIELSLQSGDLEKAEASIAELSEIGSITRSDLFSAQASRGQGIVAMAREDSKTAARHLREAVKVFSRLGLPYESALAHADLARAYRADGASSLATMELKIAKSEFEKLGAVPDAEEASRALEGVGAGP